MFNLEKHPKLTWEDTKINFDVCKIFYNTEIFKTVTEGRKNIINN